MDYAWAILIALVLFFPVYISLLLILMIRSQGGLDELISRKERLIMFGWALLWFIWIPRNWNAIVEFWKSERAKGL